MPGVYNKEVILIYPPKPYEISVQSRQFREIENAPSWIVEPYVRGMRCIAHRHHGKLDLWNGELKPISASLTELRRYLTLAMPNGTSVDGVLFGEKKNYNHYFAFDVTQYKNKKTKELHERITIIRSTFKKTPYVVIPSYANDKNKLVVFYLIRKFLMYDGMILKNMADMYPIVTKSKPITQKWLKVTL